ncbi:MAG: hypothetical protein ACRCU5_02465 [Rhizobiaceae bacterium]
MVEVTVTERLRALYRKAIDGTGPRDYAARHRERAPRTVPLSVPEKMPAQSLKIMSPGRRAVRFDGLLLCSGQSDGRTGRGCFHVEIYQKVDQTFLTKVNRVEISGDMRLVMTSEATTIQEVRETLDQLDPARCVPIGHAGANMNTDPIENLQNIATFLAATRAEYRDLISTVFAAPAKAEERPEQ